MILNLHEKTINTYLRNQLKKLDYLLSFIGGILNAIASDFHENNNTKKRKLLKIIYFYQLRDSQLIKFNY